MEQLTVDKKELVAQMKVYKMFIESQSKTSQVFVDFLRDSFIEIETKGFDLGSLT